MLLSRGHCSIDPSPYEDKSSQSKTYVSYDSKNSGHTALRLLGTDQWAFISSPSLVILECVIIMSQAKIGAWHPGLNDRLRTQSALFSQALIYGKLRARGCVHECVRVRVCACVRAPVCV